MKDSEVVEKLLFIIKVILGITLFRLITIYLGFTRRIPFFDDLIYRIIGIMYDIGSAVSNAVGPIFRF